MKTTIFGVIIIGVIIGIFMIKNPDYKLPTVDAVKKEVIDKGEELAKEKFEDIILSSETLKYESNYGFSFDYSKELIIENNRIILPSGKTIQAVSVARYVKEEWCSASGLPEHCSPFLENPAIAFGVIGISLSDVVSTYLNDYLDSIEPVDIAGIKATQFYAGVEGEGIVTILVPLKDKNQTLIIQYTYDEIFDNENYKNKKEYLSSKEQKEITDKILGTLEIE